MRNFELMEKKSRKISIFWLIQICGWVCYFVIVSFIYLTLAPHVPNFFLAGAIEVLLIISITSLLRFGIIRYGILQKRLTRQIMFLLISALIVSFVITVMNQLVETLVKMPSRANHREPLLFLAWVGNFTIILIWNLLYFAYHYVTKSNKEILDKARLESVVKELELKTIKAHINPHFIFNALNSIRFLVDENPKQARFAITELSKLLRSSMYAETMSTTHLEAEIDIVQSYLELEKIRFEERLVVEWDIAPQTLNMQIPPMMLQTLVENSIKHGISHQIDGGIIKITAKIKENILFLRIENSGKLLTAHEHKETFGIASTKNRLALLYNGQASFSIKQSNHETVIAEVKIPETEYPLND